MSQLSLWGAGQLSPIPEVRESAPLWPPESAAGNAAELERLAARRGSPPTEVDCPWCGAALTPPVAALYVEEGGCYYGLPGVDPWPESRDARGYPGPAPVVAHPPCQRWGRFWGGCPRRPRQYAPGDDDGCFAAALRDLSRWGGVLEHPADSLAWRAHRLSPPPRGGGWIEAAPGLWTCCVYQGHYGHVAGKATWLLVSGLTPAALPELFWGPTPQRLHPRAVELHGPKKAARIGIMAMIGGKNKTKIRNATPPQFRDLLLSIARGVGGFRGVLEDHQRPDGQRCRGTYEALEVLRGR